MVCRNVTHMKILSLALLLIGFQLPAVAANVSTPGAIVSLLKLPGAQFQYDSASDLSILTRDQQTQFTLSVLPATEPELALQTVLSAFGGQQYISTIKVESIAGQPAASMHVKMQTSDWWLVVKLSELNLFIRVQDVADAKARKAEVERLVKSVRFAPASNPAIVSGNYITGSNYSGSSDSSLSVFSESSISLQANGGFSSSAYTGVSGTDVTGLSQGDGPRGWWQVRGNRILAFEPPVSFYNYRFEAFSNGLEVYTNNNEKLLWTRN